MLSWNEIILRAKKFSKEWQNANYEKGETQSFYNDFFQVFGRKRRDVGIYERAVEKLNNKHGFIDLFWPSVLLVEQKSEGRDLEQAQKQAIDYYVSLKESEKPRYILLSDFQNFEFIDLETRVEKKFKLGDLSKHVKLFGFIAGRKQEFYRDQDPVNVRAAELISSLFHSLKESGFKEKDLEIFLTRIVYCLFAEDTGIFQPSIFFNYFLNRTNPDGSDTGAKLTELFQILNTPFDKRQKNIDEDLNEFPYINGDLFSEKMQIPSLSSVMRSKLLNCCDLDWAKVSPALFGSLFQTVVLPEDQRQDGAHYTSEKNILKSINPLFLDYLKNKLAKIKEDRSTQKNYRLKKFHEELSKIKIFDPACGCGNFLIVSYRELRRLEIEVMKELYDPKQQQLDVNILSLLTVNQFYGIEINYFAARIAKVALWLVDHQMNMELSDIFGINYARIPIYDPKNIVVENSLTYDWNKLIDKKDCSYIIGNPPFVGSKKMDKNQKQDLNNIFKGVKNSGELDYVSCWFVKSAEYITGTEIKVSFVSTNSISQGEQVAILWNEILKKKVKIFFAHKTFKWTIDEKKVMGMHVANVFVVIIGFSVKEISDKYLFDYEKVTSDPVRIEVKRINPYLIPAADFLIKKRNYQISNFPEMTFGSMPNDGGNLLFDEEKYLNLKKDNPTNNIFKFIKPFIGAKDHIKNKKKWCLWLKDVDQSEWVKNKLIVSIIEKVKSHRNKSTRQATKKLANVPWQFGEVRHKDEAFILMPRVTSSRREYIPIDIVDKGSIAGDTCCVIHSNNLEYFGFLNSSIHMTWVKNICGRLKDDFRYSIEVVYNNFPFIKPKEEDSKVLKGISNEILQARKESELSLEKLYDPLLMPKNLRNKHVALNKQVMKIYDLDSESDDTKIMLRLFNLIEKKDTK